MLQQINQGFQWFIALGASAMMFLIITMVSLVMRVRLSKALEGGLRLATALTGMSAVISLLTGAFGPVLEDFVKRTGSNLSISDLGWAPMGVITWGSVYTLVFAVICICVNAVLLICHQTNTLNVDLFNIWHLSILGLLIMHYSDHNLLLASLFVMMIYGLMLVNADVMKPRLNEVLGYQEDNITTTAHPCFLFNPVVLFFDKLISRFWPGLDQFDFDAEKLNNRIGFWGSKFAIGVYLGIFVGLLGQQPISQIFTLAFTGGVCLELFAYVGGWFGPAIGPLSEGITNTMNRKFAGRKLHVAIDWPIVAERAELWACANILAPILIVIAMLLPGNKVLPLGGVIMTCLVPSLLVITKGKIVRMSLIGTIVIPLFLWAATAIAEFMTSASLALGNFPSGLSEGSLFSSIEAVPLEKLLAILIGKAAGNFGINQAAIAVAGLILYVGMFVWYFREMKK